MRRQTLTDKDLYASGHALRLRDVMAITGLSRPSVLAEMDRGALVGFQVIRRPGSPWLFERADVRDWWEGKRWPAAS